MVVNKMKRKQHAGKQLYGFFIWHIWEQMQFADCPWKIMQYQGYQLYLVAFARDAYMERWYTIYILMGKVSIPPTGSAIFSSKKAPKLNQLYCICHSQMEQANKRRE